MFSGFRSFWKKAAETVYDTVASLFRTQAEIDDEIETDFTSLGYTFTYDATDIPINDGYKRRKREFLAPEDAIKYITDGGIPANYVYILALPDWTDEGDTVYQVWVQDLQ
jgi:hypothetical protein